MQMHTYKCIPRHRVAHDFHRSNGAGLIKQGIKNIFLAESDLCADKIVWVYASLDARSFSSLYKPTAETRSVTL